MKKLIYLSFIILMVFSCGDEVQFNSPAFQGDKDGVLWRAEGFSASVDVNGGLTLTGTNDGEVLELILPSTDITTYVLGNVATMEAKFTNINGVVFSTNNEPPGEYPEIGEVRLDEIIDNTFTGTFRFHAFDNQGNVVNFTGVTGAEGVNIVTGETDPIYGGVFYRIPLVSGTIPTDPVTCQDKETEAAIAKAAYEATYADDVEFIDNVAFEITCNAYKAALIEQQNFCGDIHGAIQELIDNLGDCIISCEQATDNRLEAETQYNAATIGNYIEKCNQYEFYLLQQIEFCTDESGDIQAVIDSLDCEDDDGDGVPNVFEKDDDGNPIDTDLDGTDDHLDTDDDNDGVLTADEAVDEEGNPIDTDGDGIANYLDIDDDGDGILTANEDLNMDGDFSNDDTDTDDVPNYLDNDDDGDTVLTAIEDVNMDGDPTNDDTDMNGVPNYLDNDDDGDGILTADEDANMDGDPTNDDADMNGIPDYLQA